MGLCEWPPSWLLSASLPLPPSLPTSLSPVPPSIISPPSPELSRTPPPFPSYPLHLCILRLSKTSCSAPQSWEIRSSHNALLMTVIEEGATRSTWDCGRNPPTNLTSQAAVAFVHVPRSQQQYKAGHWGVNKCLGYLGLTRR